MARSLGPGGVETSNFPKICSGNFYEKWRSFKLIAFTVFVQFRKGQKGGGAILHPLQNRVKRLYYTRKIYWKLVTLI